VTGNPLLFWKNTVYYREHKALPQAEAIIAVDEIALLNNLTKNG
jgi:hypothetical protein